MNAWLFTRLTRVATAVALLAVLVASVADARPDPRTRRAGGFNLFAGTFDLFLVNRVACGVTNEGQVCVDPGNSPIGGGGFWPKGTPDQYIFQTGIQIAGIIPADASFAWAGDTVGVYFVDTAGGQESGSGLADVFNSLNPSDVASWPNGAFVHDTSVYNEILINQAKDPTDPMESVGQQDLWTRAWDGDPTRGSGRKHPAGVMMEYRGMAWNYPSGNEDIIYFVFDFYNVTASDEAPYRNGNIDPEIQDEVWQIGQDFQANMEDYYGVALPNEGYAIADMYASFTADMDVGDFENNYGTAVLPFNLGAAYKSDFLEPDWTYPPDIFGAPFAAAPGFVGVKYLRSPADPTTGEQLGITLFSNFLNVDAGFMDPEGVVQLWRYLSGKINTSAGDNRCTFDNPIQRRLCFLAQESEDSRFFQSSGPFTLEPGQRQTIVVAYIHAAPVASAIEPYIGGDLKPGIPATGIELAADPTKVRDIDRAMGWVSATDVDADGEIEQPEVEVVPRSLLAKSLIAQSVVDEKFLLPAAPLPPNFYLVPGEDQVTIVWEPSVSETTGDPYYNVASKPLTESGEINALFDPNFRFKDVEGYRIYRGRTSSDLQLIAQFDYVGGKSVFTDYTGAIDYGQCAPELGILDQCPVNFDFPITNTGPSNDVPIAGNVVQVKPGDRVELADGSSFVVSADTAVVGGGSGLPALTDNGVPFAFVDRTVRNSLRYTYTVTAFDLNSVASGPTSLESAGVPQNVVPRSPAGNARAPVIENIVRGDDGVPLEVGAEWPKINADDGTFSGNIPPTNSGVLSFLAAVPEALPQGDIIVRIDSAGMGFNGNFGDNPLLYVTMSAGDIVRKVAMDMHHPNFNTAGFGEFETSAPLVPYDSALSRLVGLNLSDTLVRMPIQWEGISIAGAWQSQTVATTSGRYGIAGFGTSRYLAHSRWFDEGGAEPPDPTIVARADPAHNAGKLTGVNNIWAPSAYRPSSSFVDPVLRGANFASGSWYPADFVVTWGDGGTVEIRDVTHNITLPYAEGYRSGYGFLNLSDVIATGMDQTSFDTEFALTGSGVYDIINYQHLLAVEPACSGYWHVSAFDCIVLSETAEVTPLDYNNDGTKDDDGVILVVNGEPFFLGSGATLPASGTQWHLRAVTGLMTATCTPALGETMTDCSNYTFEPHPRGPTNIPGLEYVISVKEAYAVNASDSVDLDKIHTVPDPYYATNEMEVSPSAKVLRFVNLPAQAIIRIYSLSGVLLRVIEHSDLTGGGQATWDLRNRNNQYVASGVYFYHVEAPNGQEKVGRFTVVNYTP